MIIYPNSLFMIVFTSIVLTLFFVMKTFQIKEEQQRRRKDAENKKIIEAWQNLGGEERKERIELIKNKVAEIVKKQPKVIIYCPEIVETLSKTERLDRIDIFIITNIRLLCYTEGFKYTSVLTENGERKIGYYYDLAIIKSGVSSDSFLFTEILPDRASREKS